MTTFVITGLGKTPIIQLLKTVDIYAMLNMIDL